MDQASGKCPVCFTAQGMLTKHLATHSKEEIIQALSSQNASQEAIPQSQVTGGCSASNILNENKSYNKKTAHLDYTSSNIQNSNPNQRTLIANPVLSSAPILSYQTTLAVPPPLISGIKNNSSGINTSVLSSFPPIRPNYITNGQASGLSQFSTAPSNVPVLYRPPNTVLLNNNEGSTGNSSIILQSSNLSQNIINLDNSIINQSPSQAEVPLSSPNNQILNPGNNIIESSAPLKCNSDVAFSNQGNTASSIGQSQPVFCILPFSPVQPSVPSGGNYILYNNGNNSNNIIPGSNIVSDVIQPTGVNYIIGTNNSSLAVNNTQFSNNVYYLPPNVPPVGLNQGISSHLQNPDVPLSIKSLDNENITPTSSSNSSESSKIKSKVSKNKIHEISTQSDLNSSELPPVKDDLDESKSSELITQVNGSSARNNAIVYNSISKGTGLKYKSSAKEKKTDDDKVTTIEVGSNIKISVPKDILKKKERLKELINRELVRAILINDSDDAATDEEADKDVKSRIIPEILPHNSDDIDSKLVSDLTTIQETIQINRNNEFNQNKIKSFSTMSNPINTSFFDLNSIPIDPNMLPTTTFRPLHQEEPPLISASASIAQSLSANLRAVRIPRNKRNSKNFNFDFSPTPTPHIDSLFVKSNSQFKTEDDKALPGGSGIKYKDEVKELNKALSNSSFNLLSNEKSLNFLGEEVFSDMSYEEEQVLGAVEEVFANGTTIHPGSLDCKNSDLSFSKLPTSLSFDSHNISFENPLCSNYSINNDIQMVSSHNNLEYTSKKSKDIRTYYKSKKSTSTPYKNIPIVKGMENRIIPLLEETSQINLKLQNISQQIDEETADDPNYDIEIPPCTVGEVFSEEFSGKCLTLEEEHFSEDSKGTTSLYQEYQGIPLKFENGESNGTVAEEVMSLKASETLADSDSERATPSEEMSEIYYGRSCIFAGEPGPPNLSSQEFPSIEDSTGQLEQIENEQGGSPLNSSMVNLSFSVNAVREHTENPSDDTISLTLDANCSILPADTLQIPQLFNQSSSSSVRKCNEIWTKPPVTNWSKPQDDSKPFVTTGIIENYSSTSAHASTSGLQNIDGGVVVQKNFREDEEYDFEYESDCYGDSDSDVGHQRGPLDLEKWRCFKCNKTFKSLKEKLLHSGHHSPCSLGKVPFQDTLSSLMPEKNKTIKSPSDCEENNENKVVSNAEKVSRASQNRKCKVKKGLKKLKQEVQEVSQVTANTTESEKSFNCSECSLSFPTLDELFNHRATAFKSRNTCPICHLEFKQRICKLRHLKIHPLSDLVCSICHRSFSSYYSWSQHQLFHMGLILYECKECGHKCQRKAELEIHYRKHSGERPFKCETCLRSFVSNHSLKRHLIIHMEGQEIECDICHKKYKNSLGLSKHKLKMHSKKKKYIKKRTDFMCSTCNEVFHSEKKLAWHREIHERWPKKCQLCGECFIHQANLTKHIRLKHDPNYIPKGADKDTVFCTVCSKAYKRSSISLHMRTHTGVKPYKCNVCSKEFTVKCNYLSHKWIHTGIRDRPFKCKLCERSFHLKRFLEVHIRSHKKIRPYTCNECGKSFIYKSNYQTHNKLHTEEKQHKCSYCGKKFFRKYNLNNHVRVHTGETPFECTICKKEFTQKSNYNVHMKAFHVERHAIHEEV